LDRALVSHSTLDHETMWRYMRALLDRVRAVLDRESLLDDCLDILVDLLGADRGLVALMTSDGSASIVNARGHKKALLPTEREEISRTIIHEALESDQCVLWDPLGGGKSASFASLGIIFALAAPLSGSSSRAVLYVDFRNPRSIVADRHIEFFMGAAAVIGAVLEQHERTGAMRDCLREAHSHLMEARVSQPLADLLALPSMQPVAQELQSSLRGDSPILILGESGTGKTVLAQAIAEASGRRPIVRAVLGSADDLNTITSELFGHERGAYSGATSKRVGLVEYANGGTLILDEVLNLPPHAQQLLLDFSQFGTYRPLGLDRAEPKRAKVRIIAATNGDLKAAIEERRFRKDLYFRLAGTVLELPSLGARRQDIPALAEAALRRVDPSRRWSLSLPLRRALTSPSLAWSGNVRQLEHVIQRARERALAGSPDAAELRVEHLSPRDLDGAPMAVPPEALVAPSGAPGEALEACWEGLQADRARIDSREKELLQRALSESNGVVAHAARAIGVARTTLASRLDALGIRTGPRGSR
jgi:transcriptional regulator with GAF, ATPase, and Fis domain